MTIPAPDEFILDGSVTLAWGLNEQDEYASSVLEAMPDLRARVPALWSLEVANVLVVGERRGRITAADAARFLALLGALPIIVDAETVARAWVETIHLARSQRLSVYDASYLELAMRLGRPLATLDGQLRSAASACGVILFEVD